MPLILVDGSSYLFRAFHALPSLTTHQGEPTGAIYGVLNMLRRLLDDYTPELITVVFDAKAKTFREELFPPYKANRPKMPEELASQIAPLHAIIKAMGISLLVIEGVEADDVIGTLATQAAQKGIPVLISTGDKDMAQLVSPLVTLINTMNREILDPKGVEKKFGVNPHQIVDYLTLVGDTSDNVPGVPNVGPKTAAKWLQQYGSLDLLIQKADAIEGKVGQNLRMSLPKFPLFKDLLTIRTTLSLPLSFEELTRKPEDTAQLIHWFKRLEFKNWLSAVCEHSSQNTSLQKGAYSIILEKKDFEVWLERLKKSPFFAIDTETTSLDIHRAHLVGLSFAVASNEAVYVPLAHDYPGAPPQLPLDWVLAQLKPLLEDPKLSKCGHNLKYDRNVLFQHGIDLKGITYDTLLESYVLNSVASRHDLDSLALKHLGYRTVTFEEVAGKGTQQLTFNQIPLETAGPYSAEDADISYRLHEAFWPILSKEPKLQILFQTIEMPLVPVLAQMERNGVLVNAALLQTQSKELADKIKVLEDKAFRLSEVPFNLASPKQLQEILFTRQKLPVLSKTPGGQPSTSEEVLEELAITYPLPRVILEHRTLSKLKSTYTDKLPLQVNPKTGRIHTSFHQAVTATGRLSSSNPNLQNIPIRTEEGRKIRRAFIAPPGFKLISADYSQVELRIMADLTQDKALCNAFAHNIDIHRATAAEVLGIPVEKVTSEQRRNAKAINFGLIYGMSAFGLSKQLSITPKAAEEYMEVYFARYPSVRAYMESARALAQKQGYVETLFGRRLYLPEIKSANLARRRAAERAAINAPLQGSAADIIKRAMITIDLWLKDTQAHAMLILQVHDELVLEVAENEVEKVKKAVQDRMLTAARLSVPLNVEIGVGDNWDEAHRGI
ncbi:MAG: DNA polymerase I [Gammaproteobacteria bacterium]|nr:DNA polymerase I [Gammaproteobacteria bacterium]